MSERASPPHVQQGHAHQRDDTYHSKHGQKRAREDGYDDEDRREKSRRRNYRHHPRSGGNDDEGYDRRHHHPNPRYHHYQRHEDNRYGREAYDAANDYMREGIERSRMMHEEVLVLPDRSKKKYGKDVEELSEKAALEKQQQLQQQQQKEAKESEAKKKQKEEENNLTEEQLLMKRLGLPYKGFDSSKGKPVPKDASISGANIIIQRKFKQYMNKKPAQPKLGATQNT